ERAEALVGGDVERGGHHLGADSTGYGIARAERVAYEQNALALEVERRVSRRMAGREGHMRAARHVQNVVCGERLGSLDPRESQASRHGEVGDELEQRRMPELGHDV